MIHRWLQKTVRGDVSGSHKWGSAAVVIVLNLIDDVKLIELKGLNLRTVELELEREFSARRLKVVQKAKIGLFLIIILFII